MKLPMKVTKMTTFDKITKKEALKLKKYGFVEIDTKSEYEVLRLKGLCTAILYSTGKFLLQGKKDAINETIRISGFLVQELKEEIKEAKKSIKYFDVSIGSDESLKGDTFGGLTVCAFLADDSVREKLKKLNVKDSKNLFKPDIVKLAKTLISEFPENFHVENIYPKEYNSLNEKKSVTEIMNELHLKTFKKVAGRKKIPHIVDLYPGCKVGDVKETKAESKYLEVAAASIIARYHALLQIQDLEKRAGFFIPMGSTHVESGLLELKKKSLKPNDYVKLKFKNVAKFFS